jgi:hypothetical protein
LRILPSMLGASGPSVFRARGPPFGIVSTPQSHPHPASACPFLPLSDFRRGRDDISQDACRNTRALLAPWANVQGRRPRRANVVQSAENARGERREMESRFFYRYSLGAPFRSYGDRNAGFRSGPLY